MGIRPEFIDLSLNGETTAGYLCDAIINFVEPQGTHAILIVEIGGKETKIMTTEHMEIKPKTKVALQVRDGKAMFFDFETTYRIV